MVENMSAILGKPEALAQIVAAIIGVSGLGLTFIIGFLKTKKFQKSEKIAEVRLNVYLELTEKYSRYYNFIELNALKLKDADTKKIIIEMYLDLMVSLNKTLMVCETDTKAQLSEDLENLTGLHEDLLNLEKGLNEPNDRRAIIDGIHKKAIELSLYLRSEIGVVNNLSLEKNLINKMFS
ncbi:TPA: hypothetical protein JI313_03685 [Acinetobacter baumannii]|nr:hypothetical protein J518_0486 [Acinetobacter baumannii 1419130]HAV6236153.1 hypothetical protein [Acinetobacter baumannii]HAV6251663.1 hypothetical protein [Acinetobacter baumannii]